MTYMQIDLPDELAAFVEAQVATGWYVDASDYVRAVLREERLQRDSLWVEVEKGLSSPDSDLSPQEVIERARERRRLRAA